jgi:hypothetical protein
MRSAKALLDDMSKPRSDSPSSKADSLKRLKRTVSAGQAARQATLRLPLGKASARLTALKSAWPELVGADLAQLSAPLKLTKRSGRYHLTLSVNPAVATLVAHSEGGVRVAVEGFLGDGKLEKIHLLQSGTVRHSAAIVQPSALPSPHPVDWQDETVCATLGLGERQPPLHPARDPELGQALERLAATLLAERG